MEYPINQILHGDSYEILPTLPDKSFDTVIIDPPYGMGIDTWDKPVDVAFFTEQIKRIGKEFYAVFGQMPYLREWDRQAENAGFHFLEHISWVKRANNPSNRLSKTHEEILIYAVGSKRHFYKTKGIYEDVKIPGILFDLIDVSTIQRNIADLRSQLNGTADGISKHYGSCSTQYKRFRNDHQRMPEMANYTNVWSFLPESKKILRQNTQFHPTMKPLLLQERLVEMLTPEGGSVLDCFSGSGTTAIACQRLNRRFLCIEKEQEYYEYSLERLRGDVYQPDLNFDLC